MNNAAPISERPRNPVRTALGFLAIVFSLLILVRWWYYINAFSVNILFWDQWDLYNVLFDKKNLWDAFMWQNGPHRQGIGGLITEWVALLSGWNTRTEAFVIGGTICLAMVTALALRACLGPRIQWTDVAIPLIFLTPSQWAIFARTPNLSHGAGPLLLFMLYVLSWIVFRGLSRCAVILTLNLLLIYMGFGLFVSMITPCLFGAEAFRAYRTRDRKSFWFLMICVTISLLSVASFFVRYQFLPAVSNFRFPIHEWWDYPKFMALMLANFCGIKGITPLSLACGFLVLFILSALTLFHAFRALSRRAVRGDTVIAVLTTFTLIFCFNTAIGRISMGLLRAQHSRYITYLIPGFFGLYLSLIALPLGILRRFLLAMAVLGLIAASFPLRGIDRRAMEECSRNKILWKTAYLRTEDIDAATRASNFSIYPVEATKRARLKEKLDYLKKNRLNLYLDAPKP